jgi:DNA replication and repair protein RecF
MRLAWLELRDFRNHKLTKIDPVPEGLIVAVGNNGEGKTNLMEGMYFLCSLTSPRLATNQPLVREGADSAFTRGEFETLSGSVLVEVEIPRQGATRVHVNRSPVRRKRDLRKQVRAVFFGPHDLRIALGDPSKRRDFLDEALVAMWPLKESLITAYDKTLRQRNRLLKEWEGRADPPDLPVWDEELIATGSALSAARAEVVSRLAPEASKEFEALAGYGLGCEYRPSVWSDEDLEQAFRARLLERRADERVRRTTLVGPHRDDLELSVRQLGARAFASHGEGWGAVLCLRLGLAGALERELGEPPLLLVDDPFSALDPGRRDQIAARMAARGGQVVITVADEADVPAAAHATWDIRAGNVTARKA